MRYQFGVILGDRWELPETVCAAVRRDDRGVIVETEDGWSSRIDDPVDLITAVVEAVRRRYNVPKQVPLYAGTETRVVPFRGVHYIRLVLMVPGVVIPDGEVLDNVG